MNPSPTNDFSLNGVRYPVVLSIAGSDSGGGAGIQGDTKTLSSLGVYAATAITALTAQNTRGVHLIEAVGDSMLRAQIMSVLTDLKPDVVKIGMIGSEAAARVIVECLKPYPALPVVYDPVMAATDGNPLTDTGAIRYITRELFPLCSLVTPNLNEAALLLNDEKPIELERDLKAVAIRLLRLRPRAVLLKGGHLKGNAMTDLLLTDTGEYAEFTQERIVTRNLHGTGCTLSSAIAAFMARGFPLVESVRRAKIYTGQAILMGRQGNVGQGNGPLNHFSEPEILRSFLRKKEILR